MFRTFILFASVLLSFTTSAHQLSLQLSKSDDDTIATVYALTDITERLSVNAELDSTGYLGLGLAYGKVLNSWYLEAFTNYGRADYVDIYDLGGMAATTFNSQWSAYFLSYHQWRKTKSFPILDLSILDQREWKNTLGVSYEVNQKLEISAAFHHDRLLDGSWLTSGVENDNINSQEITLRFKPRWFEPYISYRKGEYRVRPGQPITKEDSLELGLSFRF